MPHIVNGIGTWYYGKKRIHRLKGTCEFCNGVGELESYDTTLYFVFVMIPLLPLSHKRVLKQCPYCKKHRVVSLREWEAAKAKQIAEVLARLEQNVDDRDTILYGLGLAMAYQDEELFTKLASSLANHRHDDADIQLQLAAGYSYFARYAEAEAAYLAALAVQNSSLVQRQLAMVLLKQGRPEDALPYLLPILDNKEAHDAGLLFYLVEALQAQGKHAEALEMIRLRDETFPDLANQDLYTKQRKKSERYLRSGKKIPSVYLSESSRAGYRKGGGWTAMLPRLIAPLVVIALLALYLGSAFWIGRSRKVYLVNGLDRIYTVAVNGQPWTLRPGATEVHVPEGEIAIAFPDPGLKQDPIHCRVETNFFARPFSSDLFVINPDRLAILVHEKSEYAEVPRPFLEPPRFFSGEGPYHFQGIDYAFLDFPPNLQAKQGERIIKSRVGLEPLPTQEARLAVVLAVLDAKQQEEYTRRLLRLEPDNAYFLGWLTKMLPPDEALAVLEPNLSARPLLVNNHRIYQHLIETNHPERNLRPDYEKLVVETRRDPGALYLLSRLIDGEESDKLLAEAVEANPPSAAAMHSIGWRALAQGHFDEAIPRLKQAQKLAPNDAFVRKDFRSALSAAGQHDRLLQEIARQPGAAPNQLPQMLEQLHVHAVRADRVKAQATINTALQTIQAGSAPQVRFMWKAKMEQMLCCGTKDVTGFLACSTQEPSLSGFETCLLNEHLGAAAAAVAGPEDEGLRKAQLGLLFLAAQQAKDQKLADQQWTLLLDALAKGSRHERQLGEMLAGGRPISADALRRLRIDPRQNRVLLVVAARRHPELAKDLLPLAQKLDFHCDSISLCLGKVLPKNDLLEKERGK
jgi:tetratricopeptide (TPR) repeat protein